MNKFLKLSLLMLSIPLFLYNVSAEELPGTLEEQNIVEEYTFPEEITIPVDEDSFMEEDTLLLIKNEINKVVGDTPYELIREEGTIDTYYIIYEDKEVEIHILYNNYEDLSEEKKQELDSILEDNLDLTRYYDFYTRELIEGQTLDELINEKVGEEITYIYEKINSYEKEYSKEIEGNVYLFYNHVFYRMVKVVEHEITKIQVIEEIQDDDIIKEVEEQLEEVKEPIEYKENEVIGKESNTSYGTIEKDLLEEKVEYHLLEGENAIVNHQNPSLILKVEARKEKFIALLLNDVRINPEYYEITDDLTIILQSNYLKSLLDTKYQVRILLADGEVCTSFTIKKEEQRVETKPVEPPRRVVYQNIVQEEKEEISPPEELIEEEKEEEVASKEEEKSPKKEIIIKEEKEEKKKRTWLPYLIILVITGIIGTFGVVLYKKSKE